MRASGFILLHWLLLWGVVLLPQAVAAAENEASAPALNDIRLKQEEEENLLRVVAQPVSLSGASDCSPVQRARQRLRDLGKEEGGTYGNVTIQAGHGDVTVSGNSGTTVDSSINVQVVNPNEERCL